MKYRIKIETVGDKTFHYPQVRLGFFSGWWNISRGHIHGGCLTVSKSYSEGYKNRSDAMELIANHRAKKHIKKTISYENL